MKKNLRVTVHGRVHGVFFRRTAMEEAVKLGLSGYADRLENGRVIIEAEGDMRSLEIFLRWCRRGPFLAKVNLLIFEYSSNLKNFNVFIIKENTVRYVSQGPYACY
ncbi:MAG: acylphosphatase [Parcubacteria group bacterium]